MPATTKQSAIISPNDWMVMPRTWNSGCTGERVRRWLQVVHRVHDRPVDAHLEVQMRAEAAPGAAAVADHLALADRRPHRGGEARLVGGARRHRRRMLDAREVAVAAGCRLGLHEYDPAGRGGA